MVVLRLSKLQSGSLGKRVVVLGSKCEDKND